MTAPKVNTIKRGGSRFYVNPETGDKVPGVTSILNMLPKPFLKFWASKLVAETAVSNLGAVVTLALTDPVGAIDYLKRAPDRLTHGAADVGTEVHELYERMAKGEPAGRLHPDTEIYAQHFRSFVEEFKPEFLHLEETIWSDTYGYAGSFDWIAQIDGEIVIGDNKTTKSGVHEEVALQLTAYAKADYMLRPDGTRVPLPEITAGAVFHVRPEGWQLVPVAITDSNFDAFKALQGVWEWETNGKRTALGNPIQAGAKVKRTRRTTARS